MNNNNDNNKFPSPLVRKISENNGLIFFPYIYLNI